METYQVNKNNFKEDDKIITKKGSIGVILRKAKWNEFGCDFYYNESNYVVKFCVDDPEGVSYTINKYGKTHYVMTDTDMDIYDDYLEPLKRIFSKELDSSIIWLSLYEYETRLNSTYFTGLYPQQWIPDTDPYSDLILGYNKI